MPVTYNFIFVRFTASCSQPTNSADAASVSRHRVFCLRNRTTDHDIVRADFLCPLPGSSRAPGLLLSPSAKRTPGCYRQESLLRKALCTRAASRGEHTTPSSPAFFRVCCIVRQPPLPEAFQSARSLCHPLLVSGGKLCNCNQQEVSCRPLLSRPS